jgi:cytochrome c oxidase subunit 2
MTIYLYELAWILPCVAIPVAMLVALIVTAFAAGLLILVAYGPTIAELVSTSLLSAPVYRVW